MTILREQERRQFCRFKLVFLILGALFERPPSEEPIPFMEQEAQEVLGSVGRGKGLCHMVQENAS